MQEKTGWKTSGFPVLFGAAVLFLLMIAGFFLYIVPGVLLAVAFAILCKGFLIITPNEAHVLVFFGDYLGTIRESGFWWTNPFAVKRLATSSGSAGDVPALVNPYRVSLRVRNFVTDTLKVNDRRGNPIEIGAVVVWRVADTAKAVFDVDDYRNYVHIQSETAIRHLASIYPYDHICDSDEEGGITLRDNGREICESLREELQQRLDTAGVEVLEARIMHLAYASEIAGAMLRRQQAEAVIAARQKIVSGAVGMVEMALNEISAKQMVDLDPKQKARMIDNLLVVLCSESEVEPVIHTGSPS